MKTDESELIEPGYAPVYSYEVYFAKFTKALYTAHDPYLKSAVKFLTALHFMIQVSMVPLAAYSGG